MPLNQDGEKDSLFGFNDTLDTVSSSNGSQTSIEYTGGGAPASSETHLSMYPFKIQMLDGSALMPHVSISPLRPKRRPLELERALKRSVAYKAHHPVNYTILVIGSPGTGKSTFVRMLFDDLPRTVGRTTIGDVDLEIHEARTTENQVPVKLRVIDVPHFNLKQNNSESGKAVVQYIEEQLLHYIHQEEQPDRRELKDHRVHACVYFLPPQVCPLPLDIKFMRDVSNRTNLIPVVSRSDSCTAEELIRIKRALKDCFSVNEIQVAPQAEGSPYSIVCSTECIAPGKKGRRYPWGCVDIEASSELKDLYKVLFGENMLDLMDELQNGYYAQFRSRSMMQRFQKYLANTNTDNTSLSNVQIAARASKEWNSSPQADHSEQVAQLKTFYIQQYNDHYRRLDAYHNQIQQVKRDLDSQLGDLRAANAVLQGRINAMQAQPPSSSSSLPLLVRPFQSRNRSASSQKSSF